jgi:DNA-binding response OmpR family regulator
MSRILIVEDDPAILCGLRDNLVWGYESYPSSRTVDNHVAGLRAKLEPDSSQPEHIKTVHWVGYKVVP